MWTKFKNWIKKNWLLVLNPFIIITVYFIIYGKGVEIAEVLLALTFMTNVAYWGYKLFGPKEKPVK